MDFSPDILLALWGKLIWPLIRLLIYISIGLIVANLVESLNWTRKIASVSRPLINLGHLSERAGAAFSLALVSGVTANTMLAEAYDKGEMSRRELVLANLFNSLPTYFLHLPTVIVITAPLIKTAAIIYVSITFGAAVFRTIAIVILSRYLLPKPDRTATLTPPGSDTLDWPAIFDKTWRRFKKRIRKIALFTVPIYIAIFVMNRLEFFSYLENRLAEYLSFIPLLTPQSMGIIALQFAAELTAGLAAAGALLQEQVLTYPEIIMALIVGNILSSPVRAIRHQFPYYAGIFKPRLALELIIYSQVTRILSLVLAAACYFAFLYA